jgi:predicted RNA binding protein YcfA (HicA-like mRNA interferase family)
MSRVEKAVVKILGGRSDANLNFDDLCFVLERAGFTRRGGKGSHAIFFKEGVAEIINLQPKGGKAKPYQVKQVRDLILKYQLEID